MGVSDRQQPDGITEASFRDHRLLARKALTINQARTYQIAKISVMLAIMLLRFDRIKAVCNASGAGGRHICETVSIQRQFNRSVKNIPPPQAEALGVKLVMLSAQIFGPTESSIAAQYFIVLQEHCILFHALCNAILTQRQHRAHGAGISVRNGKFEFFERDYRNIRHRSYQIPASTHRLRMKLIEVLNGFLWQHENEMKILPHNRCQPVQWTGSAFERP